MVAVAGRSKGCVTCRKRKVRCDQARPSCANCIRLKFTCGGYDRYPVFIRRTVDGPQRTAFLDEVKESKKPVAKVEPIAAPQVAPTPPQAPEWNLLSWKPAGVHMSQNMWHALQFFSQYTVIRIADATDSHFWNQLVPSLGQSYPSILNLTLALASVHQKWQSNLAWNHLPQPNTQDPFAIGRTLEASRQLVKSNDDGSRPLLDMVSCLLLIAIELLQGHSFSAYLRIEEGLRILDCWQQHRGLIATEYDCLIQQHVATIFARYAARVQQGVEVNAMKNEEQPQSRPDDGDLCIAVASGLVQPQHFSKPGT